MILASVISTLGGQVGEAVEGAGVVGTMLTLSAGMTVDSGAVMVHLPSSGLFVDGEVGCEFFFEWPADSGAMTLCADCIVLIV